MAKKKLEEMDESELLYELLWKKHNAIDPTKIISSETSSTGAFTMRIGGKKMTDTEINNLQSEAHMIEGTRLWKLMVETSSAAAEDSIFRSSKNIEDIHYGKAILFSLSILKNVLTQIQRPNLNRDLQEVSQERFTKTRYQESNTK